MEVQTFLYVISLLLIIAGSVSVIWTYGKNSIAKNTIELQGEQIVAQSQRIDTLESEAKHLKEQRDFQQHDCDKKIALMEERIKGLEEKLILLESLKTGSEAIIDLATQSQIDFALLQSKLDLIYQQVGFNTSTLAGGSSKQQQT